MHVCVYVCVYVYVYMDLRNALIVLASATFVFPIAIKDTRPRRSFLHVCMYICNGNRKHKFLIAIKNISFLHVCMYVCIWTYEKP